jgi:hypothetical protein
MGFRAGSVRHRFWRPWPDAIADLDTRNSTASCWSNCAGPAPWMCGSAGGSALRRPQQRLYCWCGCWFGGRTCGGRLLCRIRQAGAQPPRWLGGWVRRRRLNRRLGRTACGKGKGQLTPFILRAVRLGAPLRGVVYGFALVIAAPVAWAADQTAAAVFVEGVAVLGIGLEAVASRRRDHGR